MNSKRAMAVWVRWSLLVMLVLILAPAGVISAQAKPIAEAPPQTGVDIEVFVREGCPHCAKAEVFLAALAREHPELRIAVHDIHQEPEALLRLRELTEKLGSGAVRVPAFHLRGRLILGYSDDENSGLLIRNTLGLPQQESGAVEEDAGSCGPEASLSCEPGTEPPVPVQERYEISFLGRKLSVEDAGLPLFTLAMGLLDGFNPCSMWVLLLMMSLLAPMGSRVRMLAVAGTFVAVEGVAYFVFMAAWLNLFLFIGLSRASEVVIAGIALFAGAVNIKDCFAFGQGFSLSIPQSAKPGIYVGIRRILQADNLIGALIATVVLAILVQIVEFLCTSGFPALYTRILTLHNLNAWSYYGYLLLYNFAYMLDDMTILGVGVYTLSQRRLQEREGRWLKLVSGLVMVGLGVFLLVPGV